MDLFPLWNSLRIAAISTVIVFFAGIFAAYYIAPAPAGEGRLDVVLTLPLVLPPTVIGYLLLRVLGPKADPRCMAAGAVRRESGHDVVVGHFCHRGGDLPLMYRTARGL